MSDHYSCSHLFDEGINTPKFAEMVSQAILKTLHRTRSGFPKGAVDQWKTMSRVEKLAFIYASLECFYWIYIARNKDLIPFWETASTSQKVERAAGFCLFILGTEFEEDNLSDVPGADRSSTEWIN